MLTETLGTLILAKKAKLDRKLYKRFKAAIQHDREKRQGLFRYATGK